MKKKLLSLLVVTAMALGIVGCGGKTEPKKEENTSVETETNNEATNDDANGTVENKNKISAIMPIMNKDEYFVFTYDFSDFPEYELITRDDSQNKFYVTGCMSVENKEEKLFSINKGYVKGYGANYISVRSEKFTPEITTESTDLMSMYSGTQYDTQKLSTDIEYFKTDMLSNAFSVKEGDEVWEYNGFYIVPEIYPKTNTYHYKVVKFYAETNYYAETTVQSPMTEFNKEYVESIVDRLSVQYISSADKFDKSLFYYEDAISDLLKDNYGIDIGNAYDILEIRDDEIAFRVLNDNTTAHVIYLSYIGKSDTPEEIAANQRYENLGSHKDFNIYQFKYDVGESPKEYLFVTTNAIQKDELGSYKYLMITSDTNMEHTQVDFEYIKENLLLNVDSLQK